MIEPMATVVRTDHAEIEAALMPLVAADPVRHTVVGTVALALADRSHGAWLSVAPGGADLAVRSSAQTPVLLVGAWADEAARADLVTALRRLADVVAVTGRPDVAPAIADSVGPVRRRMDQRLFRLDALCPPPDPAGGARRATVDDRELLVSWWYAFAAEADMSMVDVEGHVDRIIAAGHGWLWQDADPVSFAARRPVLAGCSRLGPVYTPRDRRGRGYGSAVTAAASADVLGEGATPVLFTDLANPTSNALYQRLGYRPVDDYSFIQFR